MTQDKNGRRAKLLRTNYHNIVEEYKSKLGLQEKRNGKTYSDEQLDRIVDEDLVSWSRIAFTNMVNDDGIENAMKKALSRNDVNNLGGWINSFLKKLNPNSSGSARYLHTQETQASYESELLGAEVVSTVVSEEDEFPNFEAVVEEVQPVKATKTKKSKVKKVRLEALVTPEVKAKIEKKAELNGETVRNYAGMLLGSNV